MLVVISKLRDRVYIKVWDSLHTQFAVYHRNMVQALVKAMQLMGGLPPKTRFKLLDQQIPLQQRNDSNMCGFHVLTRIWMESTGQVGRKIAWGTVDAVRKYVQFMILSKKVGNVLGENSSEEEFEM